jgi:hypothetical protein
MEENSVTFHFNYQSTQYMINVFVGHLKVTHLIQVFIFVITTLTTLIVFIFRLYCKKVDPFLKYTKIYVIH